MAGAFGARMNPLRALAARALGLGIGSSKFKEKEEEKENKKLLLSLSTSVKRSNDDTVSILIEEARKSLLAGQVGGGFSHTTTPIEASGHSFVRSFVRSYNTNSRNDDRWIRGLGGAPVAQCATMNQMAATVGCLPLALSLSLSFPDTCKFFLRLFRRRGESRRPRANEQQATRANAARVSTGKHERPNLLVRLWFWF